MTSELTTKYHELIELYRELADKENSCGVNRYNLAYREKYFKLCDEREEIYKKITVIEREILKMETGE